MQTKKWDALWINAIIATCENGYGLIDSGALATKGGQIAWVGTMATLPGYPADLADAVYDVNGRCITPGFIDCHTHLVYAGNRAHEFEQRLQGVSYEEIAKQGGGIQSTVTATRAVSEEDLLQQSLPRAKALLASGVTTLEIKSGYGLDLVNELKMLRVARHIAEILPITVCTTLLGAHTVPAEFKGRSDAYVDLVCDEMIPAVSKEKLADAVDVFCEKMAFSAAQMERVFKAAQSHGLSVKCHAEQLSDSGGAVMAAKYHAISVDHLEYVTQQGVAAIATSGTVAVLLPGAFYYLREKSLPPVEMLREYQVPIAIASDCNPGTSPVTSILLVMNMACTLFRLTPEEALLGVTCHAATALGLQEKIGTLTLGKVADFCVWEVGHPVELVYYAGAMPLRQVVKSGCISFVSS